MDHASVWFDPKTKLYVLVDEPYEAAANAKAGERAQWAHRHSFEIRQPIWPGIYNPDGGSRLYLIADSAKGVPLAPLVEVLDRLPSPRVEAEWDGQSAPMSTELVKNKPRRLDVKKSARPIGKMPIEAHAEVGRLLQSVLMSAFQHDGIYDRLTSLCGELDGWAEGEYTQAELPNEQFFKLYYNGESSPSYEDPPSKECRERQVADLVRVKEVLTTHYPDCPPLRSVLKKTDAAAKSLQQWGN
jgi:hypothetical protein